MPEFVQYVIYDHPLDYPGHYVVRKWRAEDGELVADADCYLTDTLDDARRFIPTGLICLPRTMDDADVIVEVWI